MIRFVLTLLIGLGMTTTPASSQKTDKLPTVIILLGPPGSGKGTQAIELSTALKIPHISTGDLFRENIKNDTPLGRKAKEYLDKGQLAPDSLVFDILFDRISKPDCSRGYILDGFPRTSAQAHELEDSLRGKATFIVFNFQISDAEVIHRMSGRLVCKKCQRVYHKDNNPPKKPGICDVCGGELYQRSDDTEAVIKERLRIYHQQTKPLEEFFRKQGLVIDIDVSKPASEVQKELLQKLTEQKK